jgi:hypothetical protein
LAKLGSVSKKSKCAGRYSRDSKREPYFNLLENCIDPLITETLITTVKVKRRSRLSVKTEKEKTKRSAKAMQNT